MNNAADLSPIRVSVQFNRPTRELATIERGADRFDYLNQIYQEKAQQFLAWLRRNHIEFWHFASNDSFGMVFLDVLPNAVQRLADGPDVSGVNVEQELSVELLRKHKNR